MMAFFRIPLFFWLLVFSGLGAWAAPEPTVFETTTSKGAVIKGMRYSNVGKPPFVLFHGLTENSRIWRELGLYLHSRGFDVWMPNFRGHGKAELRSLAPNGNYSFDAIMGEDVPAVVEHVFAQTKQKMTIAGHSMGDMASEAYASGATIDSAYNVSVDPSLALKRAQTRIRQVQGFGGPTHFREILSFLKTFAGRSEPLLDKLPQRIPGSGFNRSPLAPDRRGLMGLWDRTVMKAEKKVIDWFLPLGVLNPANMSAEERETERMLEKAISPVESDLLKDFHRFSKTGKWTSRNGVNYQDHLKNIVVPTVIYGAEFDQLTPPDEKAKDLARLKNARSKRFVFMKNTSHIDMISGKRAAEEFGDLMVEFARHPNAIGDVDVSGFSEWALDKVPKSFRPACNTRARLLLWLEEAMQ